MKKVVWIAIAAIGLVGCAAPLEAEVTDAPVVETESPADENQTTDNLEMETDEEELSADPADELGVEADDASDVCLEGKLGNMWVLLEEENCIEPWPLTSTSGILFCDPYGEGLGVVVWNPDEDPLEYYALNGMALGQGYPDIEPFWKDNPGGTGGPKVDIGPLIKAGLSLCDE